MKTLIWLEEAEFAREAAIFYIAQDSIKAALSQLEEIDSQVDSLLEHPNKGRRGKVTDTRELIIQRTSFVVVYRVSDDLIEIIDFVHMAQDR